MSSDDTAPQKDQAKPKDMAEKSAFQPGSYQDPRAEGQYRSTPHLILSAHKNTPCIIVCRGCGFVNRQDRLF